MSHSGEILIDLQRRQREHDLRAHEDVLRGLSPEQRQKLEQQLATWTSLPRPTVNASPNPSCPALVRSTTYAAE